MGSIGRVLASAVMLFGAGAASAQAGCDRRCLGGKLDGFLAAVVAKDPARAGLAQSFRQTQNSVVTRAGDGVWRSLTAFGPVDRRYFDPVTGNALFFGLATDAGEPAVVSVRVKVDRQKIVEAEWHVAHRDDPGIAGIPKTVLFDDKQLALTPPPQRVVPRAERSDRATLEAVANSYFDGITAGEASLVVAHPGCGRFENGFMVTGRPLKEGETGHDGKGDCTTGYRSLNIGNVAARRYLLVDEEAQVVVASAVFVRRAGDDRRRNHFMELFPIDRGRISSVYAAMFYAESTRPLPNWPPYEANFPPAPALTPVK